MRWKLRSFFSWVRDSLFFIYTSNKIRKIAKGITYDVLHIINQGAYSEVLCEDAQQDNKELWVSFHDHFTTTGRTFNDTKKLWIRADRRLVISKELGDLYNNIFGQKNYETITDGIKFHDISEAKCVNKQEIIVYFAGLMHYDYYPLVKVLADALDVLSDNNLCFKLVLRGVSELKILNNRNFTIEYRNDFISDQEIAIEMNSASILYLPIKFSIPEFYLYSLSTKMISYLGASGTILYHGPRESAAAKLLEKANAAVICQSLEVDDMFVALNEILSNDNKYSKNAKQLVKNDFNLEIIQNRFWQEIL